MRIPRRIALLSEHASPVALLGGEDAGGQNVYVDEVSRHLGSQGFTVDVFTRRDRTGTPSILEWAPGVRVVNVLAGPPRFLLKDAIWAYMGDFRDAVLRFARRQDMPYDILHGNFWMSGWAAAELSQRLGIPAIQIFHALGMTKRRYQGESDTSPLERIAVERGVVRDVDALIATCPSDAAELINDYGAAPHRVQVIAAAVNTQRFRPVAQAEARDRLGLRADGSVVVYVGRMLPRKDVRNIVRAIALLANSTIPPITLLVVGGEYERPDPATTPEIGAVQHLAEDLGIADRVRCVGMRQPDLLRDYYCAGDVVVTTPWYEPFGLTPLEAMACGLPVIGSAVGGLTFTIRDGETGLLVPPRDPEALAARLAELLASPARMRRMGHAGRMRVLREFTWPMVAARTAALYESVLTGRSHAHGHLWNIALPEPPSLLDMTGDEQSVGA